MCVYSCVKTSSSQSVVLHRGDLDRIIRKRRRRAVREIRLIDEDHLHAASWDAKHRRKSRPHLFGDRRQAPRQLLFTLVSVNVEVRRAERSEPEPPVVARVRVRVSCGGNQQRCEDRRPVNEPVTRAPGDRHL